MYHQREFDIQNFLNELNKLLSNSKVRYKSQINRTDFAVTDSLISDIPVPPHKFKRIIFNNCFPRAKNKTLFHYTSLDALQGISDSKSIWLTCLSKRFHEGEFDELYKKNGMEGYSKRNIDGISLAESIVDSAYYLSLAPKYLPKMSEDYLWKTFGRNFKGVRIELLFRGLCMPLRPRKVLYDTKDFDLIYEMSELVKKYNRLLVFSDLSSAGFFQLNNHLSIENEYRILVKESTAKHLGMIPKMPVNSQYKVIEIGLSPSENNHITIKNVEPGVSCDIKRFNQILKKLQIMGSRSFR